MRRHAAQRASRCLLLLALTACGLAGSGLGTAASPGQNGLIAFLRGPDIFVMQPDGSGARAVVRGGNLPAWSPEGARLAYIREQLTVVNADGSGSRTLATSVVPFGRPTWSPDGNRIAFAGRPGGAGQFDLYVINVDGTGETRVTTHPGSDSRPDWSPDGTRLAFTRDEFNIYVINVDGTGARRLADGFFPDWSPDGAQIAYYSNRGGNFDVFTINSDGTGDRRLTTDPTFDGGPSWSPDGTRIAFLARRDGNDEIYVMNADGSGQANLSRDPGSDSFPDWQALLPADLAVTQSARPRVLSGGRSGTLRVIVRNGGRGQATGVRVQVAISAVLQVRSAHVNRGGRCTRVRQTVTCMLATLAPAGALQLDVGVRARRSGNATSRATVTAASPDPATGNNRSTLRVRIR